MIPQSQKYANHLFHLAQMEILAANMSQSSTTHMNCTELIKQNKKAGGLEFAVRFFEHTTYWKTYSHLDPGEEDIFSFLSIWKCANNQLRSFLEQIFPGEDFKQQVRFKDRHEKFPEANNNKQGHGLSECILAVIRDPIAHFLSGYNEIEYRIRSKEPRRPVAQKWPFGGQPEGSIERFEQFVADLLTCPIGKKLPGIINAGAIRKLELEHLYSMTGVLRLLDKDDSVTRSNRNFHYLPSLKNLNETWGPFVVSSCPRSFSNTTKTKLLTTPMITESGKHESSGDPHGTYKSAKLVWKHGGPTAKALCAIHLMDYACWQDLPDGVPRLCMDLYVDYHRRNLLL
ncbi:unnamed protein product [Cylindrotheca closterium]|uniref:Sulfotransferase n=1 Tax=Cylindrotheca closterium TaxID=2856 RepID=A0AAD2G657_9STRA|nr:unnamed protein product [Cylindrotheca closterium]